MDKGLLIALEGIDGSGHSTQARMLREYLEKYYSPSNSDEPIAVLSQEPTDGPVGGEIREYLSKRLEVGPETLALMFAADRKDHVENLLENHIQNGKIVILDRYVLSSLAYQGVEVEDDEWLFQINSKVMMPDVTILLDVSVAEAKRRMERDRLKTEMFETEENLRRVRSKYKSAKDDLIERGYDVRIIDGENSKEYVNSEILDIIQEKMNEKGDNAFPGKFTHTQLSEYVNK